MAKKPNNKPDPSSRTIEDFRRLHDPMYCRNEPGVVYDRELRKGCKRFLITAAQNATPLELGWWDVLLSIAHNLNAELLVIPLRYKNPTSQWTGSQQRAEHWAPEARPYLWNRRIQLHKNLTLLADIPIQPTAESPLTGAEAISTGSSGILGATKLQLKSVPVPAGRMAKILTTTGACTVENYTQSRTGQVAAFHHSFSAVLVELDGAYFHLRQVHYDRKSKSATDLNYRFLANGTFTEAPRALALGQGDTHVRVVCPKVDKATHGRDGIVELLQPEKIIWADLLDGQSINPHHDPLARSAVASAGRSDVRKEITQAVEHVRKRTPKNAESIIQACNHNDFLRRWALRADWRDDHVNAEFLLRTQLTMLEGAHVEGNGIHYPDPFAHWFRQAKLPRTRVLDLDEPFVMADVALHMHGDKGPNGSRGSIRNHRRIGSKSIIFHSHIPGIDEGVVQAGTSTHLRLDYNHGLSGWLNAHVALNADGKRQLIIMVDGRYHLTA